MKGRPAKVLADTDVRRVLTTIKLKRHVRRDRVIMLLSVKAGLRAGEIAKLTWLMVSGPRGEIGQFLELPASVAKKGSGRRIPLHGQLRAELRMLKKRGDHPNDPIIRSERGGPMTAKSVVNWFSGLYQKAGLAGCSSHSGRRTFITRGARLVLHTGGSLRDVQELAGHRSIQTTQGYIEGFGAAQRRLIRLI
ncbi:MAG: tyrosine-type recombinase/integrase [Pseudomonadota bacterium]